MTVQGGPTVEVPQVWIDRVRGFMRDFPVLKEIHDGAEHDNQQIGEALVDAVYAYNSLPPLNVLDVDIASLWSVRRDISRYIIRLATIYLLESIILLYQSIELTTPSGSIQENLADKWRSYESSLRRLEDKVKDEVKRFKISTQLSGAFGVAHSDLYYPYRGMIETYTVSM